MNNSTPHSTDAYDQSVRATIPFYEQFHKETINFIKHYHSQPKTWLDTGCGTGELIAKAFSFFKDVQFTMCDPSESMIEAAKEKLQFIPEDKIKWKPNVSSVQLNEFINEPMDVATALLSHHYLSKEERQEATQTIYQLLKDGGIYITFENIYPASEMGTEIGLKRWAEFQIAAGRDEKEVLSHTKRFNKAYYPITLKEHLELLQQAGFKTYDVLWYSYMQAGFYGIK